MPCQSDLTKAKRIAEAAGFPKVILLDNCSACNLACSMCDHKNIGNYREIETMKWGLYTKIIDEIAVEDPTLRLWEIFFGDPFLCRDMPKRLKYAKDKGLRDVVLNSNGNLMTAERARAYIEAGLDAMYVGLDAACKETYEKIRVKGNFDAAVANTLKYRDLLRTHGKPGQKLFVQFVVTPLNETELEAFKDFWTRAEVNVKIRPMLSWAGLVPAPNLRPNCEVARKPCYWLMRTLNICADGQVALCSVDLHCQLKCGDARVHTIKELWAGRLKELRNLHKTGRFSELPALCANCSDWQAAYAEYVRPEREAV